MKIDIIMVTYNSKKYINGCINSILKSKYDLKQVGIYICDNNSNDETITILKEIKEKYQNKFNEFKIIESKKNNGFGIGNNIASKYAKGDYLFFLNVDCEIFPDTLSKISASIPKYDNVGIYELKQQPYEHPKYYDPISKETKWASGACMIIPRKLFKKIKGFDKHIFMYCEDVEISYRIRKLGYSIIYLNEIPIIHYSYLEPAEFKWSQYTNCASNNLYVRFKYGTIKDIIKGTLISMIYYRNVEMDERVKKVKNLDIKLLSKTVKKNITKMFFKGVIEWFKRIKYIFNYNKIKFDFDGVEFTGAKDGAFYQIKKIKTNPLVSIIVRTCGRPDTLRETLISIKNQTYKNIEVVIVEDGKNLSEKMLKEEFSDLNIKYRATGKKVGRCKAGNLALSLATGKYLNFLDDDDLFYEDHVEVLVSELENSALKVAYATSFETPIIVESRKPYKYKILGEYVLLSEDFNILKLLYCNITPIQCVMFAKEVYDNCGGLDESLDALEDWDLWVRYGLKYPFKFVEKTTSIYRVPGNPTDASKRAEFLNSYLEIVRNKYKDEFTNTTMNDVVAFQEFISPKYVNKASHRLDIIKKIIGIGRKK